MVVRIQVANDWLDLRVPVFDADIRLIPDSSLIVTGTANGFVSYLLTIY